MSPLNFGTHNHPLYFQEDGDDINFILDIELGGARPRRNRKAQNIPTYPPRSADQIVIDDNDDDHVAFMFQPWAEAEEELEREVIDLSDEDDQTTFVQTQRRRSVMRNGPLLVPAVYLTCAAWFEHVLKPRMTVEVNGFGSRRYLCITDIIRSSSGTFLRGVQYVHIVDMQGMLPWSPDTHDTDICAIYHVDLDDPRPMNVQAAVEVPLDAVKNVCKLKVSNALWPVHAASDDTLVCRWKFVQYFPTGRVRERHLESYSLYQGLEAAILRNDESDADPEYTISAETLRTEWAEHPRIPGGSYIPPNSSDVLFSGNASPRQRIPGQKYTFFDAFCGAGGASRGAMRAGLHLKYAVDAWDRACDSYQTNFRNTQLFRMKIDEWIRQSVAGADFHCDVLHLSPPCQVFSPAHTINSREKDEANFAALFACEEVLRRVKPRVFTLEQTFGLLHRRWRPVFHRLLASFSGCGYSVRWKYVFLPQWGLPARRKRLIMIGAAAGEILPGFPAATHGDGDEARRAGLRPLVTVRQALKKLDGSRRQDPLHRPGEMKRKNMPRWDTDGILARCVTTSGGQNYHYSGQRCFTHREFAILQGFPMYHEFVGSFRIRQIGNAFPPCTALVLFQHIQKCLLEADGMQVDDGERILAEAMAVEVGDDEDSSMYAVGDYEDEEDLYLQQILEQSRHEYSDSTATRQSLGRQPDTQAQVAAGVLDATQKDDDDWRLMLQPDVAYSRSMRAREFQA
ncbi:hypothetical protein TD95_000817 [Thielaviopsis punctulata]|uniref:DNA (cytosine-5-)-methyltransferase n=1 Tax=Thielaviopsis punctulata TaxID=72032 RepID=A0A0F4ZN10_9PEZI|nr:hypothetical protein TD95_000817 [Thielaviopsis punctulata]